MFLKAEILIGSNLVIFSLKPRGRLGWELPEGDADDDDDDLEDEKTTWSKAMTKAKEELQTEDQMAEEEELKYRICLEEAKARTQKAEISVSEFCSLSQKEIGKGKKRTSDFYHIILSHHK